MKTSPHTTCTTKPTPPTAPAALLMTADEARRAVAAFHDSIRSAEHYTASARHVVLDLYEREGWRALGYESWRACAVAELGLSQAHVYRLLTAAQIERDIAPALAPFAHDANRPPELPEALLRPLAQLETPQERQAAATQAIAAANGTVPTAMQMQQVVERIGTVRDSHDENRAPERVGKEGFSHNEDHIPVPPKAAVEWRLEEQGAADVGAARRSLAQDDTSPRPCEDCGGRATNRRLIGGVLAWRCDACAQLDAQMDALGLGGDGSATAAWTHWVALGRILAREDACIYAVQLLRTLAPFIAQVRPGNRGELRAAIARLHACEAGSEAAHWLAVGWMLLDVEPPDAVGEIGG